MIRLVIAFFTSLAMLMLAYSLVCEWLCRRYEQRRRIAEREMLKLDAQRWLNRPRLMVFKSDRARRP